MVVEVESEEYKERCREQGRRRDSEAEAAGESKKARLALADMPVYAGGGEKRMNARNHLNSRF